MNDYRIIKVSLDYFVIETQIDLGSAICEKKMLTPLTVIYLFKVFTCKDDILLYLK